MDIFSSYIIAASFLIIVSISWTLLRDKKKHVGRHPPSPARLPFIGNLHQLGSLPHQSLAKLAMKNGPVMLLKLGQIPTLVVSTAEMAEQVLKTHDIDCCSRAPSYGPKILSYNLLDISFVPYNDYWREMRKLCVLELFSMKRVNSFTSLRELEVKHIIEDLSANYLNREVDMGEKVFSLLNNILCKIAFGKRYEGKQFGNKKFEVAIHDAIDLLSCFWVTDFFPRFGWIIDTLTGKYFRLKKWASDFDAFLTRVIDEHLDPSRLKLEKDDIVDILLKLYKDDKTSFSFSLDHVKAMLFDVFFGGIDTSSNTIVWAMTELMKNPRVMKKLQFEIRALVGKNSMVGLEDLEKLNYLKMVVKETFRLHPPSTLLIPRECVRHCKIGGYDVYPKTMIFVNVWAIGRDPKIWDRPEEFYPERFDGGEVDFKGRHFELIPFGSGRRICPAIAMGNTNIELGLANLLHSFDWELPQGMIIEDISLEEETGLTVHKKLPLHLVPIKHRWE
ncbi:cytochrome P450 71B10-like [Impatiens glandulifera]|uniref:cytochrome P450 71B10-like n=1 Tax=Impatiens glandulifera TaxID=253017 RepID=UPI001FB124C1|nr:cytochrome P450 71B10-like [Impatiens glandulifera]